MSKAISPSSIAAYKAKCFPGYVFDAFNELIAENFTSGSATVYQKDVVERILAKAANAIIPPADEDEQFAGYGFGLRRAEIFARGYLNVEEVYREQGWKVKYDEPAYNESYDSHFIFEAR